MIDFVTSFHLLVLLDYFGLATSCYFRVDQLTLESEEGVHTSVSDTFVLAISDSTCAPEKESRVLISDVTSRRGYQIPNWRLCEMQLSHAAR